MCVYDRVSADGCVHASETREGGSWSGESRGAGVNPRDCVCFSDGKRGWWLDEKGGREGEREGGREDKECSSPVALGASAAGIVLCPVGAI